MTTPGQIPGHGAGTTQPTQPPSESGADARQVAEWQKRFLSILGRSNDRRQVTWTPWLFLRYTATDLGFRPIPSGTPFWASPDIWIESSDPNPGKAVAGENNFVHARIFNLGRADATPTRVDFYWANPAVGLGPANMNFIGTEWVEVRAFFSIDVRCNTPWVPLFLNNGHECLMVNCSAPILDPITQPFQPTLDRHVAQRNIAVIEAMAGELVKLTVAINNFFPLRVRSTIRARIEHVGISPEFQRNASVFDSLNLAVAYGQGDLNSSAELMSRYKEGTSEYRQVRELGHVLRSSENRRAELLSGVTSVAGLSRSAPCISSEFGVHTCFVKQADANTPLGNVLVASDKITSTAQACASDFDMVLQEAEFQPNEQRSLLLELTAPANARPGEFVVFHLSQHTERFATGGYTIVLQIKPGIPHR